MEVNESGVDASADVTSSELGTKAYWDRYYQHDIENRQDTDGDTLELSDLESWFDDVGAPSKVSNYLTSTIFPLLSQQADQAGTPGPVPHVLDLGTGNGGTLISLALEGGVKAHLVGVDYSEPSVVLARQLWNTLRVSCATAEVPIAASVEFVRFDIIQDSPKDHSWWPAGSGSGSKGFDLILDKGTFDAISLSSDVITEGSHTGRKAFEVYPQKVADMVKPGGYFLITSCNWTEDEVITRFSTGGMEGVFEVFHTIQYPVYQFGGQHGQGVASVCFRRKG